MLAQDPLLDFRVYYGFLPTARQQGIGFERPFKWDVPLLDGYAYTVLENIANEPTVEAFQGCDTPSIGEVLERDGIDVLVINGWLVKMCIQGLRAARRLGIKTILRSEANDLRGRAFWKRWIQRLFIRQFDAVLYIGKNNHAFYRRRGVADAKMFFAPYSVDNRRFAERPSTSPDDFRKRFGIAPDKSVFLYCGKFEPKKHPVELIKSFQSIAHRADCHLLMVGTGPLEPPCKALAESQGLPVTFAGFLNQSELPAAYHASDCLILPSDAGETWGLVVNEAMAAGKPAIVSDQVGCAADLVEPGHTGWIFPFGRWEALADCLMEALADRNRLRRMGKAARARVDAYTPQQVADGIRQAVQYCLRRRDPASRITK